jgi:hypothetical protein
MMRPTVNRSVHYVARGSADGVYPSVCRAAIITEVEPDSPTAQVGVCVLNPTGHFYHPLAVGGGPAHHPGDEQPQQPLEKGARCNTGLRLYPGGTWHWAEIAEGQ